VANETIPFDRVRLVHFQGTLGAGGTLASLVGGAMLFNVAGLVRVVGNIHSTTAPAAGFPTIEMWTGNVVSLVQQIGQDPTQADFQYPFDLVLHTNRLLNVTYTDGGGAGDIRVNIYGYPE
jgi:hypothetical protein